MQQLTPLDHLIVNFDNGLRTLFGQPLGAVRRNPAQTASETELTETEKRLSVRLMRANHTSEVSAQALYHGQALTARPTAIHDSIKQSALEENDHLVWCKDRIHELNGHVSLLNPLWYTGSYTVGAMASITSNKWSLGLVTETERQVLEELKEHQHHLPPRDFKSKAILEQIAEEKAHHANAAIKAGGVPLPKSARWLIARVSKVMTKMAFWF